jgi:hypothetical protein
MAFVLDASIALGWVVGRHETALPLAELLRLARRHDLSAYDAAYLALALELKMPLACGDGALKAALPSAGVKLA